MRYFCFFLIFCGVGGFFVSGGLYLSDAAAAAVTEQAIEGEDFGAEDGEADPEPEPEDAPESEPKDDALPLPPANKPYFLPYVGDIKHYKTRYEDTLVKIARTYNLGFNELRSANPEVDPWLPGANVDLVLPTRHLLPDAPREGIVVNLADMRLYYFYEADQPPITHPLGVGREGLSTPSGQTRVVRKIEGPTWRPTARMREEDPELPASVPAGPENPMGTHALYLGWPEYALHGTNKPFGIGRRVSSGCIRLYPEDILTFYDKVPVGTAVRVVNQPVKLAWIDDVLYLEAHPPLDQADKIEQEGGTPVYDFSDEALEDIGRAAGADYALLRWDVIRAAIRERRGYPVAIADRHEKPVTGDAPSAETEQKEVVVDKDDRKKDKKAARSEAVRYKTND